ncbi:MAG: HlyD family secretion protein, partial [Oscillospiraceae bacterium]|nr:HlyD family secretion protein [Oscillospiraceae bacterium]
SSKTNSNSDYQKSVIKNNALSGASKDLENAKNDLKAINDQIASLTSAGNSTTNADLQNLVNQRNLKQRQVDLINLNIQSINENENLFQVDKDDEKSYYYSMEAYLVQYQAQDNNGSSSADISAQIQKLKNDMLIDINTNLKNIADKKSDYDVKLSSLQNQANNLKVMSPQNGYIHYVIPVVEGVTVDASKVYAKINGVDTSLANMITMIPAAYIKNITIDCPVKVSFDLQEGYNKKYISGKITSIDSDVTTDVMANQSFYKAYIKLDDNIENPRTNMPAEVKIVYDKKKWVDYILEMLSFKPK